MSVQQNKKDMWFESIAQQWSIYAPPVTPSKSECQIIKKCILNKKRKNLRILVLGATPEFRDLAHELKAEVTCVDVSVSMLQGLVHLMKQKNKADQEIWFKADWLTVPLAENYFDFVLGDFVIVNLPINLQPKFFSKIKHILRKNGFFITRHLLPLDSFEPFPELIGQALKNKSFNKRMINSFSLDVLQSVYEKRTKVMKVKKVYSEFKKLIIQEKNKQRRKRIKDLFEIYQEYYPLGKAWWGLLKNPGERVMKKYFKIQDIRYGQDHDRVDYCPIYFLRK